MERVVVPCTTDTVWRSLYEAAIFEARRTEIPRRVSEAETAVLARGREVFHTGASLDEQEALEDALYILRAYRSAWEQKEAQNITDFGEAIVAR